MARTILYVTPERGLAKTPWIKQAVSRAQGENASFILAHAEDIKKLGLAPEKNIFAYGEGNLTPQRNDLKRQTEFFDSANPDKIILLRDADNPHRYDAYRTWLRLLGCLELTELDQNGSKDFSFTPLPRPDKIKTLRITACGGIGNVILTTAMVKAALKAGIHVRFRPIFDADRQSLAALFENSQLENLILESPQADRNEPVDLSLNIDAPAFLQPGDLYFSNHLTGIQASEAANYANFLNNTTGLPVDSSQTFVGGSQVPKQLKNRIVVCPGSKAGWDSKRWPHMNGLLEKLGQPVVLCRPSDLQAYETLDFLTPITAQNAEYLTDMNLAQAAGLLKSARAVIANECGLAHMAAAAKAPTLILFGPSSDVKNVHPGGHVRNLMLDMDCRPCQDKKDGPGRLRPGDYHCDTGYACLRDLTVDRVLQELRVMLQEDDS